LTAASASKRTLLVTPGYVLRTDLNEFLYAPVYEERHGMTLSVLSALARLGLDPWEQATTLATHTREAAARELALLMSALPEWAAPGHDAIGITARLVALLPAATGRQASAGAPVTPPEPADHTSKIMWIYAIIMLLLMSAQWLSTRSHREPPDSIPQLAPQSVAQSVPSDSQHKNEIAE
jgi:hypothetical protein